MLTCATCIHFKPPTPSIDTHRMQRSDTTAYSVDHVDDAHGYCNLSKSEYGGPKDDDYSVPMYADDSDSYSAWLRVLPTFGCSAWTAPSNELPAILSQTYGQFCENARASGYTEKVPFQLWLLICAAALSRQ